MSESAGSTEEDLSELLEVLFELRRQLGLETNPVALARYQKLVHQVEACLAEMGVTPGIQVEQVHAI
jgi:hypothetical protein